MVMQGDRRGAYRKRSKSSPSPAVHFEWRNHNGNGLKRVWRSDWFNDQFEIMNEADFESFKRWAKRFSFLVIETP
jgi:hypothetical protein